MKGFPRFAQNEPKKAAVDMTTLVPFQVQPRAPGQPQGRQPPSFSFSSITAATPRCSPRARGGSEESANGKEAPRPRLGRRGKGGVPFKGAKSLSPASPPGGAVSPKSPGEARAAAASTLPHLSRAPPSSVPSLPLWRGAARGQRMGGDFPTSDQAVFLPGPFLRSPSDS